LSAEDGEKPPLLARDQTPLWSSRFDVLADALHRFEFKASTDREIAQAVYDGETWASIKSRLQVGRSRIARVLRNIRDWARGG
jgi:hypothetical protein